VLVKAHMDPCFTPVSGCLIKLLAPCNCQPELLSPSIGLLELLFHCYNNKCKQIRLVS
jgi:hypothetical protein